MTTDDDLPRKAVPIYYATTPAERDELVRRLAHPEPLYRAWPATPDGLAPSHTDGHPPVLWACGNCGRVYPAGERAQAERCYTCRPTTCERHGGVVDWRPQSYCRACADEHASKVEADRFARAIKVPLAEWWRAHPDLMVNHGDEYAYDEEDLEDLWAPYGKHERPAYVWATKEVKPELDVDEILRRATEDAEPPEHVDDPWTGIADLRDMIDRFNALPHTSWYVPDYTTALLLPKRTEEA